MIILSATTDTLDLVSGQAGTLDVHVSWVDLSGTTATPGRTNTAIATATTTAVLAAPAASTVRNAKTINIRNAHASTSMDVTLRFNQNATIFTLHKVTIRAGEALEYVEGVGFFLLATNIITPLMKVLSADETGQNVATAQPWFPTAGAVAVAADTTYRMEGLLALTRAAGVTSHTTGLLFAGTASLTSIQYIGEAQVGETEALLPHSRFTSRVATNTTVKAASTTATEAITVELEGIVRVNAAGTLIPQFIYSAIPGGAPTVKANSYFRLDYLGTGGFTVNGTWS